MSLTKIIVLAALGYGLYKVGTIVRTQAVAKEADPAQIPMTGGQVTEFLGYEKDTGRDLIPIYHSPREAAWDSIADRFPQLEVMPEMQTR
jgi:hypothetical protein